MIPPPYLTVEGGVRGFKIRMQCRTLQHPKLFAFLYQSESDLHWRMKHRLDGPEGEGEVRETLIGGECVAWSTALSAAINYCEHRLARAA